MATKKSRVKGRLSKKTRSAARSEPQPPFETEPSLSSGAADESEDVRAASFPIVGIGASAGGLEAFIEMLEALPPDSGLAYVFVQHLDPKHASLLREILQRGTKMPVQEATNGLKVEPNHVYVIPRDVHITLVQGALRLASRQTAPRPHMAIDPFLRSLAADQGRKAIGVILSGNASDGTLGMRAIKSAGGITFAQSLESAKSDGMPRSAIAAGCIDFVLSPKQIAAELARLGQHPYIAPAKSRKTKQSPDSPDGIPKIVALLRASTGVDFALYKSNTIHRRIMRRMALRGFDSVDTYLAELRSSPAEVRALYEDILINVTEFFRDPAVFAGLKKFVFPKLDRGRGNRGPIRIWVPGCASGEEAYSIAIALVEFEEARQREVPIQIFATDISEIALEKARNGVYPAGVVQSLSNERVRRFFIKHGSGYQISKRIREMCIFALQNIVKDPPFSRVDLVSCRNVLIYLGPLLQKRALEIFHYALKPSGFLLLGTSESIGTFDELFAPVSKKLKIYTRRPGPRRFGTEFVHEQPAVETSGDPSKGEDWPESELSREADRIVLSRFAPAGVVVDDDLNIVQFRGHTSPYLEPSPGTASLNLLRMAREGLFVELRNAVNKARRDNKAARHAGLRVRRGADFLNFNLEVIPLKKLDRRARRYLVLFEPVRVEERADTGKRPSRRRDLSAVERQNRQLRQDLAAAKEYLQSLAEEHESSNEELRSANEEIQSSNEELRSTNEELETAKEELQSINEELNTVNEELQNRNSELTQTGNDLSNLLGAVNVPIVMLGNDLRIRRFTPAAGRVLNLMPTDIGRSIQQVSLNLEAHDLDHSITDVIANLTPKNLDVKDFSGRRCLLRIRPYRTEDNRIDGAVLVLADVETARTEFDSSVLDSAEKRSEELQAFSAGLLLAQERERGHLSRELHDDFNQRLALVEMEASTLARNPPAPKKFRGQMQKFQQQIASLSDDLRRVAYRLHPAALDTLGLGVVVESYAHDFGKRERIEVQVHVRDVPENIPSDTALGIFRVLQESLRNIALHSGATAAEVSLTGMERGLQLIVKDAGNGFVREAIRGNGGLGLYSMEERIRLLGGMFQIKSAPQNGTEITVEAPCAQPPVDTTAKS